MERRFRKRRVLPNLSTMVFLELIQSKLRLSGLSIKNKTMETPMKQKLKTRNNILFTVLNLIQMQNLHLSDYLLIDYPKEKKFRLFILQYPKNKIIEMYILVISLFTGKK